MVLFVHGRGNAVMQGPKKVYSAQTVADMIAANGKRPSQICLNDTSAQDYGCCHLCMLCSLTVRVHLNLSSKTDIT